MEIKKTNIESSQIGEFKSIKSTISEENMGLAFTMVSKNLYSDPIGSFIREITSNAVDANVDAHETSPVLIHIYEEGGDYYIEFKDKGTGISPDNFTNIYMSWFNSDKRKDNTKIGGWGLGSKSPLAYQDSFEIITTFEGTTYHYVLANTDNEPVADLLTEEETDDTNGTTIRIMLHDYNDVYKVHQACKKQLVYFNNVYVKNDIYFYDNNFKIYESENYKLRNVDRPYNGAMHICLGQVTYPIDWDKFDMDRVMLPVALKFNIGEIDVSLSREAINYTNPVKEAILAKINLVTDELVAIYEEQLKITDLFEFIYAVKSKERKHLIIKDIHIPMKESLGSIYFSPIEGVKLSADTINDIFSIYNVINVKKGKAYPMHSDSHAYYFNLYRNPNLCYLRTEALNYYDTMYIYSGYLFKKAKLSRHRYKKLANVLGLVHIYRDSKGNTKTIIKEGTAKKVAIILKYVDSYLKEHIKTYEGTAPVDWIEEQKAIAAAKKEDTKGNITYYNKTNNRTNVKLKDFIERYTHIFCVNRNLPAEKLAEYFALYEMGNKNFKSKAILAVVSPTTLNKLSRFSNVHTGDDLFRLKSVKALLLHYTRRKRFEKLSEVIGQTYSYSNYYTKLYRQLQEHYNKDIPSYYFDMQRRQDSFNGSIYPLVAFQSQIDKIKSDKSYIFEDNFSILEEYAEKMQPLRYLKTDIPHNVVVTIVKALKLRKLNAEYYTTHKTY